MIAALAGPAWADDHLAVARVGEEVLLAATWSGHVEVWRVGPDGVHAAVAWPERPAVNPGVACGRAGCLVTATVPAGVGASTPSTAGWLVEPRGAARGPLFFGPGTRATPIATRRGFLVVIEEPTGDDPAVRGARLAPVAADGAVGVAERLPIDDALGGTVRPDPDGAGVTWVSLHGAGFALRFGGAPTPRDTPAPDLPLLVGDPPRIAARRGDDPLVAEIVARDVRGAVAWIGRGREPGPDGAPSPGVAHVGATDPAGVVTWSVPVAALGRARADWVAHALLDRVFRPDADGRNGALVVPTLTESVFGRGQAELALTGAIAGEAVVAAPPDADLRAWAEAGADPAGVRGLSFRLREHEDGRDGSTSASGGAVFPGAPFEVVGGACGALLEVVYDFQGELTASFERGAASFVIARVGAEGSPGRDGERDLGGAWEGPCAPADPAATAWLRWQLERDPVWSVRSELGPPSHGMGL